MPESATMDDVKDRLRDWRQKLGLTQEQMAARLGTHVGMIRKYEGGHAVPGGTILAVMANEGLDLNWLLTGDGYHVRESPPPPAADHVAWYDRISASNTQWNRRWGEDNIARGVHNFLMGLMREDPRELPWLRRSMSVDEYQDLVDETVLVIDDVSQGNRHLGAYLLLNLDDFRALLHVAAVRLEHRHGAR